jgi:hypothetical protein
VTADGLLLVLDPELFSLELASELPSLDPLEEVEEPEDCELDDADCVPVDVFLDALTLLRSDELEVAAALRLAAAASAGSWPETSCT